MKRKGEEHEEDDEKEEPTGESSSSSIVSDYLPSMISSVPLVITLRYLPMSSTNSASVASSSSDPYPTEEEGTDYLYYVTMIPVIMLSAFCMVTFLCNAIFGRRPDFDGRHNPVSHQIAQGVGDAIAPTLAVFGTIIRVTSTTILGQRAAAINRFVNRGLAAVDVTARAATTADELYDHAMDRCPVPNTGDMRRIEYGAMLTENAIVATIEFITHGIFAAMEMGMTRVSLNPQNRLYVLAGIYRTADLAETFLVTYTDDLAWFLEHIVDTPLIARILINAGIADPEHPIHGVDPRDIPERLQDGLEEVADTITNAANNVADGFNELGEKITDLFTGGESTSEGTTTTFNGPMRFGHAVMSNAATQTLPQTQHNATAVATSSSSGDNHEHSGGVRGFISNLLHPQQHTEIDTRAAIAQTTPVATLNQQPNGSYTAGFPPTIGNAHINIPPEVLNHITFNDMHFEIRQVPITEQQHHGRPLSYFRDHHRVLDDGIDSYRIPADPSTNTPEHTLIRLTGRWEIRIYGETPDEDTSA